MKNKFVLKSQLILPSDYHQLKRLVELYLELILQFARNRLSLKLSFYNQCKARFKAILLRERRVLQKFSYGLSQADSKLMLQLCNQIMDQQLDSQLKSLLNKVQLGNYFNRKRKLLFQIKKSIMPSHIAFQNLWSEVLDFYKLFFKELISSAEDQKIEGFKLDFKVQSNQFQICKMQQLSAIKTSTKNISFADIKCKESTFFNSLDWRQKSLQCIQNELQQSKSVKTLRLPHLPAKLRKNKKTYVSNRSKCLQRPLLANNVFKVFFKSNQKKTIKHLDQVRSRKDFLNKVNRALHQSSVNLISIAQ